MHITTTYCIPGAPAELFPRNLHFFFLFKFWRALVIYCLNSFQVGWKINYLSESEYFICPAWTCITEVVMWQNGKIPITVMKNTVVKLHWIIYWYQLYFHGQMDIHLTISTHLNDRVALVRVYVWLHLYHFWCIGRPGGEYLLGSPYYLSIVGLCSLSL